MNLSDPVTQQEMDAVSGDDCVACLKRELAMRARVYPKWIEGGRMKPEKARAEIVTMSAVLRVIRENMPLTKKAPEANQEPCTTTTKLESSKGKVE